jgi:hypothetical protein
MTMARNSSGRRGVLAGVAVVLGVTFGLAGCGTAPGHPAAATRAGGPATAARGRTAARVTVAAAGSLAQARAVARHWLAGLVLPAGTAPLGQRPPAALPGPGFTGAGQNVDLFRYFRLPVPMAAADSFLRARPPAGLSFDTTGTVGGDSDVLEGSPRRLPPGIAAVMLEFTMAPDSGGGSLLRADAQVMIYPARSAAEYLNPAAFRSVTVSAARWDAAPASRRTITSRPVIAMLAGLVNGLPVQPPGSIIGCPAIGGNMIFYQLVFTPAAAAGPAVVVRPDGCLADQVSAGGAWQPPLADGQAVTSAAARLLQAGSQPPGHAGHG